MDTGLTSRGNDMCGHSKGGGGHEVQANRVHAKESDKTVDSATILEVTQECNGLAVDGTQFGSNGVNVQQCLKIRDINKLIV